MTTDLDLILLPLVRHNAEDQENLPGLHVATAPRRAARGRSGDRLVMHLELDGNAPISPKGLEKILENLAQTYFSTSGSSTAAMRTVTESLNEYLLDRNIKGAARSMQVTGYFTLVVLRGSHLFVAQCGPTHAILLSEGQAQDFHDSSLGGQGLGRGRATNIQFRQAALSPGDALVLTNRPPEVWSPAAFGGLRRLSLEAMHQRLIHEVGPELEAALIYIQGGTGKARLLRPRIATAVPITAGTVPEEARSAQENEAGQQISETTVAQKPDQQIPVHQEGSLPPSAAVSITPAQPVSESASVQAMPRPISPGKRVPAIPPQDKRPTDRHQSKARQPVLGPAFRRIGQASRDAWQQTSRATTDLFKRMLPDESVFTIPSSVMAFIAVAVPLLIVTVASVVYFREGRERMYAEYVLQAQTAAEQAMSLQDANAKRVAWSEVLRLVNLAETFKETDVSNELQDFSTRVLDDLNGAVRMDFKPAFASALPYALQIAKMVTNLDNDLYMLNAVDGNVFRATFTAEGYVLDTEFICGPVPQPLIVGALIDIMALPSGDPDGATVMGMDSNGNLLKCIPGGKAPLAFQMGWPDTNWGTPVAFAMDAGDLYVLDPQTNAVWIYWARDDYRLSPRLFFGEQIPPMQDVIDLTINGEDLYLLHADGQITTCTFSLLRESPTRCENAATFTDRREGRGESTVIDGSHFTEIQFAPPPDPSIYLLDTEAQAIYHFSKLLVFQRMFQSSNPLPEGGVSAFTVSQVRVAFMAIGNQVFYAQMP